MLTVFIVVLLLFCLFFFLLGFFAPIIAGIVKFLFRPFSKFFA